MNCKKWIRNAISTGLAVAIFATTSMVALAGTEKFAGELLVKGKSSTVSVNGENAQSGRTIFSASTIATPENAGAVINLGRVGSVELAPNTTVTLNFNESGIDGSLANGKLTVLNAAGLVNVKTADGNVASLMTGESAVAGSAQDDDKDKDDDAGAAWWIWAAVFGGAIAGIVIAATSDNNRVALGGGTTVVSPSR